MDDNNTAKTKTSDVEHETLPETKKQKLDEKPTASGPALFSRPLAEPPIFCCTELIEAVEEILKHMREKPHLFDPSITERMKKLDVGIEDHVLRTYIEWASDMTMEALTADNDEAGKFYNGLTMALLEDYREDRKEEPYFGLVGYLSNINMYHLGGYTFNSENASSRASCTGMNDEAMASSDYERSEDSEAYVTAEEGSEVAEVGQ